MFCSYCGGVMTRNGHRGLRQQYRCPECGGQSGTETPPKIVLEVSDFKELARQEGCTNVSEMLELAASLDSAVGGTGYYRLVCKRLSMFAALAEEIRKHGTHKSDLIDEDTED